MPSESRMCGKGMLCHDRTRLLKPATKDEEPKRRWRKFERRRWHRKRRDQRVSGWHPSRPRPRYPPLPVSLRPANVRGRRAPGMRAPRNTNQFLMHEKYQLMHMRSDSVGTDSGSDCELDPADMDSYLGVLENAWGALLDGPDPDLPSMCFGAPRADKALRLLSFPETHHEESMQYFPSESDVMESEDFMQRDFKQFCDDVARL